MYVADQLSVLCPKDLNDNSFILNVEKYYQTFIE